MYKRFLPGLLLAAVSCASAQTKVNLAAQSQDVDFSQLQSVRPFPTGATLPSTCSVGQMYFLTSSTGGANAGGVNAGGVNECVAQNTWAAVQGSGGSTGAPISVQLNGSQLVVGPSCSVSTPCVFRIGSAVYSMLAPATATVTGGSGMTYIYVDNSGNLTVGVSAYGSPAVTCSGCIVVQGITSYPVTSVPIENWSAANGAWDTSGADSAAPLSAGPTLIAGSNITLTQSPGAVTISAAGISPQVTGSGVSGFNPTDPTQWYRDHLNLVTGFNRGADGWGYSDCGVGNSPFPGIAAESVVAGQWATSNGGGTTCFFYFPYNSTAYDYWSGAAPASLWVQVTYQSSDTNGAHYVGLSNTYNDGAPNDFIGCRQSGAGDWFAVIRSGGRDLATADTGVAHDGSVHRITVDNNSGTANVVRCSVDGAAPVTATAGIPAETYGWYYVAGAFNSGSTAASFTFFQYTIFLQNLPRL